jgi:hypothetical protein
MRTRIGIAIALAMLLAACDPVGHAWRQAESSNTTEAYRAFLAAHPGSEYETEAMRKIEALAWAEAADEDTEQAYARYLSAYPDGAYAAAAAALIRSKQLDRFRGDFDAQLLAFIRDEPSDIVSLQGRTWADLDLKVGIVSGGFDLAGGAAIFREGSVAVFEDRDRQFQVLGRIDEAQSVADAIPGAIESADFKPGVRIGLQSGQMLEYDDDGWSYVADSNE